MRVGIVTASLALVLVSGALASSPRTAYVPLNVRPAITLTIGQHRTFTTVQAPVGTVIACLGRGLRAEQKVPATAARHAVSVGMFKKGGGSVRLTIRRQSRSHILVLCGS
jgi:hypothetical protein